jgi:hypothetical protein
MNSKRENKIQPYRARTNLLASGILQRQCAACGQHTIAGGECQGCKEKQILLQRHANLNKPLENNKHNLNSSGFDHDFSQIQTTASTNTNTLASNAAGIKAAPKTLIQRDPIALGTAKTTAPIAGSSIKPQQELLKPLTDEVQFFQNTAVILRWLKARIQTAKKSATNSHDTTAFTEENLLNDAKLIKQLKPKPTSSLELKPFLDLLIEYGLITRPLYLSLDDLEPKYQIVTDAKTGELNTANFDQAQQKINEFTAAFEKRIKRPSSLKPIVETDLLPKEMAAGSVGERKPETQAEQELQTLEAQKQAIEDSNEDEETKQTKLASLEPKIESAKKKLSNASGYRTFAKVVVNFLKRLHQLNTSWTAGTYPGHSWGEFSVDIFLKASLINVEMADFPQYSGKYWKREIVRQFFDDLNTTAETDDPETGKFAWRGIYNDVPLAKEINEKYGSSRIIQVPEHGPAPDHKLHIHLDLRPVDLKWDKVRGYKIENGRIELL